MLKIRRSGEGRLRRHDLERRPAPPSSRPDARDRPYSKRVLAQARPEDIVPFGGEIMPVRDLTQFLVGAKEKEKASSSTS